MKFCKDCVFYCVDTTLNPAIISIPACSYIKGGCDMVSGFSSLYSCKENRNNENSCGKDAKFFEEK